MLKVNTHVHVNWYTPCVHVLADTGVLTVFPQCNFGPEFPEIHGLSHHEIFKVMHCGILVHMAY